MNDVTPSRVNALNAQRGRIDWGAWCYDDSLQYANGFKLTIDLTHCRDAGTPPLANIAQAKLHSAYSGNYLLLNEPDLVYPKDQLQGVATEVLAQMDEALAQDANAKFYVACGTWLNPCYAEDSWFDALWKLLLPKSKRASIIGFHSHIYPNETIGLTDYLAAWTNWRNERFPNRKLALTEVGCPIDVTHNAYTPTNALERCNAKGVDECYWYAMDAKTGTPAAGYKCCYTNEGVITATGQELASI